MVFSVRLPMENLNFGRKFANFRGGYFLGVTKCVDKNISVQRFCADNKFSTGVA